MILVIALIALSLWGIVLTIIDVHRDGYGPSPTDWTRAPRPEPLQHAEPGHVYR